MAVRLDSIADKPVRLDTIEQPTRLDSIEPAPTTDYPQLEAYDASLWERIRDSKAARAIAGNYAFLLDPSTPMKRGDDPIIMGLGKVAHMATSYGVGRGLYVPELIFGADLAERVHRGITEYELKPKEKTVGEVTEFVGAIKSAGQLIAPLTGLMKAGETITRVTGGAATFMLRNLSEQTVDKIKKGKPVDRQSLFVETFIGAAFGAAGAGIAKAKGTLEWLKSAARSPAGKRVPLRLWLRAEEARRAFSRPGMTQKTWDKLYKADMERLGKTMYDAHAAKTLRRVPRLTGKTELGSDVTWKTSGYQPLARRGDVRAPVRKGLPSSKVSIKAVTKESLNRINSDSPLAGKESIGGWLSRHKIKRDDKGKFIFFHGTPKDSDVTDALRKGSLLAETEEEAKFFTQRDRDITEDDVVVHELHLHPDEIDGGHFASLRKDVSILTKAIPEPHLFQTTQLMKRVPTPGEIQPPRRVLIPQSTALATAKKWERTKRVVGPSGKVLIPQSTAIEKSAFRKWVTDYSSSRALDIGMPVVPKDPDMAASRLETLNSMAKSQKRHEAKRQAAIDKSTGKPNYLNPWVSSRFMFMDFEERTGVPVYHTVENIFSKSGRASLDGYNLISDSIRLNELAGLTPLDNEHIAKYLFSPETRKDIEVDISPEALTVASRLEDILQGEAAKDVQEMVFRLWDTTGKVPPDVKQYGDPKTILRHGREAKAEGRLKEWIAEQSPWGVRRFYYMSDPMKQDAIDNYMEVMGRSALHAPGTGGEGMPGTFAYEAYVREGEPPIKEGSVVTNILTHVQRVKIANAIADDLNKLYERLGSVDLTERDKRVVKQIMDNVMMRRQPVDAPFEILAQMRRMYWRPTMSYLWRPHTALWRSLRNSLQNYAFGPFAINLKEAGKVGADVAAKWLQGIHLEQYDPEMMKRHEAVFASYVSQRQAYYHEFLLQDTANITKDFSRRGTARKAIAMMEKTGGLYGAVDEYVNRFPIWVTQYQITKRAAADYASGKINKQQFFRRTNLESVQKPQQMLVQDLLSEGRVDDLAEVSANWITEDVNFKYKTPERAGVEQTMAERSLMGIYTFPRGQVELIYRRGIKTMLQGAENKNVNQAYTGASNVIKGLMSSSAASALLYGYAGRRAYETYNALAYTMLDPGTGTMYDLLSWNWEQMMRYNNKEQSLLTTIDNITEAWAKVGETLLIPLSVEIESWYEANNDVAGVTLYRLIRNGVAAKLGIEEKAFNKVTRTQKQAVLHTLLGSYEYPPKEPPTGREGRSGRGGRSSR